MAAMNVRKKLKMKLEKILAEIDKIGNEPLTDIEKELFETLWWNLRRMYQRDVAMADNGIPFAMEIRDFVKGYIKRME